MKIEWLYDDEDECESILEQPLFEELSDKHEREDAYGGPYGVMIGGMALPTKYDLAVQYLDAADYLVACIRKQEVEDFTLANPILFLYRHSIEMLIKSLLPDERNTHNLAGLIALYQEHVRRKYSCKVPGWILDRIKDIDEVDPGSTAFRYAENRDKKSKDCVPVDGEIHVYLANIQTVAKALHSALNNAPQFRTDFPIRRG